MTRLTRPIASLKRILKCLQRQHSWPSTKEFPGLTQSGQFACAWRLDSPSEIRALRRNLQRAIAMKSSIASIPTHSRILFRAWICAVLVGTLACGGTDSVSPPATLPAPAAATVAKVTVSGVNSVGVGQTVNVSAVAQGDDGRVFNGGTITWTTSDPSVATVASLGSRSAIVTGVGEGQTTISAQLEGRSGIAPVQVFVPRHPVAFIYTEAAGFEILAYPANVTDMTASAVNDLGQVVGQIRFASGSHAYIWSKANGVADIGGFGPSGSTAGATAISQNGQVAGAGTRADGYTHAFRWTSATGITDLGVLPGTLNSFAKGINSAGQIVGSSFSPNRNIYSFRWTEGRGIEFLGSISATGSIATAINESGQASGIEVPVYDNDGAIFWSASGEKTTFIRCDSRFEECGAAAFAINRAGVVAGTDGQNPIIWTSAGGIRTLRTAGIFSYEEATGINDSGTVVGNVYGGDTRGFIWTEAAGLREILPPAGKRELYVTGINNNNQIVGWTQ